MRAHRASNGAVHPRVRGEQLHHALAFVHAGGSSPRARGTGVVRVECARSVRFIPACAGNRPWCAPCRRALAVHPRVRGEQRHTRYVVTPQNGSSPRARGTEPPSWRPLPACRFIPACAGNSSPLPERELRSTVHPRVRGEQGSQLAAAAHKAGSSPRARGTGLQGPPHFSVRRFIPACAGNRLRPASAGSGWPVHPRVRGEQIGKVKATKTQSGSSPRARGTGRYLAGQAKADRFIPACAGNRAQAEVTRIAGAVHPRVRGEQTTGQKAGRADGGSSPRARGTAGFHLAQGGGQRFIPACAGNRRLGKSGRFRRPVHPRVRGEQEAGFFHSLLFRGSSPRARGTVPINDAASIRHRFIPACAGNSLDSEY